MIQILDTQNILHYDPNMTTFAIYLNRHPDLFRRFGPAEGGFKIGDPLELVHGGKVLTDESESALLNKIFEIYNISHPQDYEERSLSVGDVVKINQRFFACQPIGWRRLDYDPTATAKAKDTYISSSGEIYRVEDEHLNDPYFHHHGDEALDDLGELDCGGE